MKKKLRKGISSKTYLSLGRLVSKLEDFCSSGSFTQPIQEFMAKHAHKFEEKEE